MNFLIFPGQGSQKPGFLKPWIENQFFRRQLEHHSEITGLDLVHLGTSADQEEISQTSVTQPLIVSASIASARTVFENSALESFSGMAGHSVGEFSAAAVAGVLSDDEALKLVSLRARAMQRSAEKTKTGMAAAIGSDLEELKNSLGELQIANFNGANQYVLAGGRRELERIKDDPPAGFRIIPLSVSGAFHTQYMEEAREAIRDDFLEVDAKDTKTMLLSNRDGKKVDSGREFVSALLDQVSSPVRWDLCMESMSGVSTVVEAAPSGVLSNLVKKTIEGVQLHSLKSPSDSIDLGLND
jgi:[acyl-carrier-protein] S-malonyltransferase